MTQIDNWGFKHQYDFEKDRCKWCDSKMEDLEEKCSWFFVIEKLLKNNEGKLVTDYLPQFIQKILTLAKEEEYEIGYKDGQSSKIADYTVQLEDFVDGSEAQEIIRKVRAEERKRIVEEIKNTDCFYCYERGEREDGLLMKRKDVGEFKAELINKIK